MTLLIPQIPLKLWLLHASIYEYTIINITCWVHFVMLVCMCSGLTTLDCLSCPATHPWRTLIFFQQLSIVCSSSSRGVNLWNFLHALWHVIFHVLPVYKLIHHYGLFGKCSSAKSCRSERIILDIKHFLLHT